ncbi:DNA mismatch repair protein MLH3-like isoform X6 [Zingiber officinale]|uniref:DNA mismatch repair protein MLH3-like isoform X6 n=1 Tax=Zingiber officinale TaxID=94328 RepID=UPI001C4AE6F2|nr:DNA mismatch repair protein MLH3-like isoform X6 [Zingiber officinale]
MNPVKRLPRSVHGPLRSSVLMFDLPRVVEELVNNSLDAGAAKVSVFVNVRTCYIKVEDDGRGISRDELVILGEKRATSKSALLDDIKVGSHGLGSEGDMMISLSDISIVEIRTQARGKPNAYCKIIKGSRCLFLGIDDQREDVGTTVVVRDLFYNQPVRRRYMQSSTQKVIHCVKKVIVRAALVHPQVSFKLIDIDREDELLNTVPASSPLPLVSSMFGDVSCSLREVGFSDDILMLTGYISRPSEVFSTKALQYLYVNLRFVSKGPIHNLLNNLASTVMCSSALHSVDHLLQGRKKRKIQANPAFILNLHCPFSLYGIHFEPSKTIVEFKDWEKILTFFEEAARHSWQQHLAPPQQGNSFPQQNHRPRKCEAQDEGTLDCNYMEDKPKWDAVQKDTVKVGNLQDAQEFQSKRLPLNYMERSRSQSAPPFYRGKCKFSVLGCPTTVAAKKSSSPFSKKSIGDLSHPYASQPFLQPFASEDCLQDSIEPSSEKIKIYDVRYPCPDNAINDIQEDSTSVLVKWRPGVYQTKDGGSSQKSFQQADDILDISSGLLHFTGDSLVPELIDKNCLHDARVLLQLDNKYIPVMASGNLMVIDQHAADERIRLEELRRKVLSGEGREITYLDSEEELVLPEMGFQLLHKYAEKIKAWGWIFNSQSQLPELFQKNLNHFKRNQGGVTLVAVPCILGINLTIKDLLEYIEQLVETDGSSSLPPSVLRILNSKACRGAIMFGDSLLPSECSLIVEELKATSLCFQCAHGRPTMAPLLNISALHEQLEKLKFNNGGANEAWHGLRHHPRSIHHAQMLLDSSNRFCSG